MDPAWVTAWATIALAAVGIVSIGTGVALSIASFKGIRLQQRQADLLDRELKIAEQQTKDARQQAWPQLRVQLDAQGTQYIEASLHYIFGTEPATHIRIWIRHQPPGQSGWGIYLQQVAYMAAGQSPHRMPLITEASAQEQERLPFKEFLEATLAPAEYFVGLEWKRLDGTTERVAERQFLGSRLPEPFP